MFNEKGHIGFLGHGAGIKFRNIRVLDLDSTSPEQFPACKENSDCHHY